MIIEAKERVLYTVEEAVTVLGGLSRASVYKLMKSGKLRSVHIGRRVFISRQAIERFAELATNEPVEF